MYVSKVQLKYYNNYTVKTVVADKKTVNSFSSASTPIKYADIPFYGLTNARSMHFAYSQKQNKLLKQINEIIKQIPSGESFSEVDFALTKIAFLDNLLRKKEMIVNELAIILDNKYLTPKQKYDRKQQLNKDYARLDREFLNADKIIANDKKNNKTPDKAILELDYELINKFKSAATKEDFSFDRIYMSHYKGLNEITTVSELEERFPKIKIPQNPVEAIVNKIIGTITRDVYQTIERYNYEGKYDEAGDFVHSKVLELSELHAPLFDMDTETFFKLFAFPIAYTLMETCENLVIYDEMDTIPFQRKNKLANITPDDKKLLGVDYEDFVLNVTRQIYLDKKKPNEIEYKNGEEIIKIGAIQDVNYKFNKPSEIVKKLLILAKEAKSAQRNYDKFTETDFKSRLEFYANREIGNNEEILTHIIDFDGCDFSPENIRHLKMFLKELDKLNDNETTLNDTIWTIRDRDYSPILNDNINLEEKNNLAKKYKQEQKKLAELNLLKDKFDDAMNILFSNGVNSGAVALSKYRPDSSDIKTDMRTNYILDLIRPFVNEKNIIQNKTKLEAKILRWDVYTQYRTNFPNEQVFKDAIKYAIDENGNIDKEKAGQYLINANLFDNYNNPQLAKHDNIESKILEKVGDDKKTAIEYLNKYDAYKELDANLKSKLSEICEIFDTDDAVDKIILKEIIENEYSKVDTEVAISFNETDNKTIIAAFCAKAKRQIINKYRYPVCLGFLQRFENALTLVANTAGSSGIKQTAGNNQALEHKMEVKLSGHDDRLFSSKNDFRFDIFSERGLH